ncbi:hypothetical protein [Helicovermis profundi]|uniref:NADH dehydrogenase subunit 3 n=1 Tax=Helicovermis profundi TaxID=3065157 RepID=A0AAU9E5Y2_9FIRM|nr:hypothetical protein HLPR_10990 [Clostridia bacterium S502]
MAILGIILFCLFITIYVLAFSAPNFIPLVLFFIAIDIVIIFVLVLRDRIKHKKEEDKDDYSQY